MQALTFWRRGKAVTLGNVSPDRTLLEVLREDLACTATKEGCGEGDCGACTVVLAEPDASGQALSWRAVNSCIRLAHSVQGMAVFTASDIEGAGGALHPAQQALVDAHGSQCGFCTPGFVMSLFGMYRNRVTRGEAIDRDTAQADLSGNLCRCTGYRPILDAAERMAELPPDGLDEAALLAGLKALRDQAAPATPTRAPTRALPYQRPDRLDGLLRARAAAPAAQLVAGCTDVGLWVTKQHRRFAQVIDVTGAAELRRIETYDHHVAIGAGVPLADTYDALVAERPQLLPFARRFAGLPVRSSGTLVGNVANGSPIGDSMPLLIALGASIVLMAWRRGRRVHRELMLEDFYTGYRRNVLSADEIVAWVKVPRPVEGEFTRVYKVSKRFDDDISAVCLALSVQHQGDTLAAVRIGAGGVAATPARARATEAVLRGRPFDDAALRDAQAALAAEFSPISDMRASADYRRALLGGLLRRFWLEAHGASGINLESLRLQPLVEVSA